MAKTMKPMMKPKDMMGGKKANPFGAKPPKKKGK